MHVLGLDFETTDIDPEKARITEIGAILWDTETQQPLDIFARLLWASDYPSLTPKIQEVTNLTDDVLKNFGYEPKTSLAELFARFVSRASYIVAHNGNGYDRPVLEAECKRLDVPMSLVEWIDTMTDVPYPDRFTKHGKSLTVLAHSHGIAHDPRSLHRAWKDVDLMLALLGKYQIEDVLRYRSEPWVTLRAIVSFETNQKARDRQFKWNPERKLWLKQVKQGQVEAEQAAAKEINLSLAVLA